MALFLVDQRMPAMSGIEFLAEAIKLYPESKRVLLTAYADTDAAIASINAIDLDYYLMKPWDPPEERLYPVLDDLLSDWLASVPVPYDGIRVAGTLWSPSSHNVKDFLGRSQIPYKWLDIERDSEARELVESISEGPASPADSVLSGRQHPGRSGPPHPGGQGGSDDPRRAALLRPDHHRRRPGRSRGCRLRGVRGRADGRDREGSRRGTGRDQRSDRELPGFPKGDQWGGSDATRDDAGTAPRSRDPDRPGGHRLRVEDPYRIVTLSDGSELSCHALLIATGVKVLELDVPGIEPLVGGSVYYGAATSEAVHYQGDKVFVIGGANSAGQGAMFLSRFASEVTILIRGDSLRKSMSQYLIDQIEGTENISLKVHTEVTAVAGIEHLESITMKDNITGETETAPADAVFIFIGAVPHSDVVADIVERTEASRWPPAEELEAETRPFPAGNQRAGYLRRGRCAPRRHPTGGVGGRPGLCVDLLRAEVSRVRLTSGFSGQSRSNSSVREIGQTKVAVFTVVNSAGG